MLPRTVSEQLCNFLPLTQPCKFPPLAHFYTPHAQMWGNTVFHQHENQFYLNFLKASLWLVVFRGLVKIYRAVTLLQGNRAMEKFTTPGKTTCWNTKTNVRDKGVGMRIYIAAQGVEKCSWNGLLGGEYCSTNIQINCTQTFVSHCGWLINRGWWKFPTLWHFPLPHPTKPGEFHHPSEFTTLQRKCFLKQKIHYPRSVGKMFLEWATRKRCLCTTDTRFDVIKCIFHWRRLNLLQNKIKYFYDAKPCAHVVYAKLQLNFFS